MFVSAVHEIVDKVPLSPSALAGISGMGESKVRKHGEHILATIWAFLREHNLLSKFPDLATPKIPECPTWTAPGSTEAEAVRSGAPITSGQKSPSYDRAPARSSSSPMRTALSSASESALPVPATVSAAATPVFQMHSRQQASRSKRPIGLENCDAEYGTGEKLSRTALYDGDISVSRPVVRQAMSRQEGSTLATSSSGKQPISRQLDDTSQKFHATNYMGE